METENDVVLDKLKLAEQALEDSLSNKDGLHWADGMRKTQYETLNLVRAARVATEGRQVKREAFSETTSPGRGRSDEIVQRHESFGVVTACRVTGGIRLFGSVLDTTPAFISLKISRARRIIDTRLHHEFAMEDHPSITEVFLSATQWAELICSLNGTGVPCTIRSVDNIGMDPVPSDAKTPLETISESANKEARKNTVDGETGFRDAVAALSEKVSGMSLPKKKTDEINASIRKLLDFVNVPVCAAAWATTRLAEDSEKVVAASKVEMAAALESMIRRVGLEAVEASGGLLSKARSMVHAQLSYDKEEK
jgi:hypothetical protein